MVVPSDQDGKSEDCLALATDTIAEEGNSRKGGIPSSLASKTVERIVVDIREFRSELPALLHKRGIEIDPMTIVVGFYFSYFYLFP